MSEIPANDLYLVVLPLIHLGIPNYGFTEQVMTLLPDKNLATVFFRDEVESYKLALKHRTHHLTGGHVTGYELYEEDAGEGRVFVRVVQLVQQ